LGALNRMDEAHAAVARAVDARERVQPDELDVLGGLCNFTRPTQLYYAAEALSWGGAPEAGHAERFALEALDAYPVAIQGGSFRNETSARCVLAMARVDRREFDGAAEALALVLTLPSAQRDHTVVTAVERVLTALSAVTDAGRDVIDLAGSIEAFTADRLALPK